jgi:hypothetical protein
MSISSATTTINAVVQYAPTTTHDASKTKSLPAKAGLTSNSSNTKSGSITEDLLYGAKAYSKIADKGAVVAKKFLSLLSKMYHDTSKFKTPVYDAVENVMRKLQRDHDITSAERKNVKLAALGTADIDSHHESLSGTVELSAVNNASHKHPWSESKLNTFRNSRRKTSMETTATPQTTNTAKSPTVSSSKRTSTTPTVTLAGMSGFLSKPISDSDGKLAILLPSSLTGLIKSVALFDQTTGKLIESGRFAGIGNGDRTHFRFSMPGGSYLPGTLVKVTLDDGSSKTLKIDSTESRVESRGA